MAALAVRGENPIWSAPNLVGARMDDQYWFYVLQNTTPYNPKPVWQDEDRVAVWSSPIQMLANGTLPENIFFDPNLTYRLEWRFNQGNLTPPSQSDELVYLVENYKPQGGGGGTITASLTTDNQMTNPQFALINFTSPLSITTAGTHSIAPGWDLILAGTGTATVTRVALNNTNRNPTNAPYALRLALTGWNNSGTYLRQRFNQNGMLWANKFASSSVTARVEAVNANISAALFDSNGTELGIVLNDVQLNSNYVEYKGVTSSTIGQSTNPDVPPNASVEYRLNLPGSVDIYVTSFQVLESGAAIDYSYEQETIQRQIDHTYNTAYPIVPVGAVIDFAAGTLPQHYLLCNGAAVSRTTYRQLFAIIGTTWGVGDGSTTFNVPNLIDRVTAGAGGTIFGGGAVGALGGANTHSILAAQLPEHTHAAATGAASGTGGATRLASGTGGGTTGVNTTPHDPIPIVQPTALMRKIIRYQ